jgi:hypothetical protein
MTLCQAMLLGILSQRFLYDQQISVTSDLARELK